MRVTDLVTSAYMMCLGGKRELHQAWITQSFKLAEITGVAHLAAIQANNQLDLIIRQLEEERSEEHTSELQSLMRSSYAVFCLKKQNKTYNPEQPHTPPD